ncbi:MAG: aspartate carbamoyltransferase regulatory subunit [Ruminococcaceae bacterium]|nr:aspartate carbamoyltransferase regulatory subunit [Oscillospiraceae bacterium]
MVIDSIKNGIVIDHIQSGRSMELYRLLNLDRLKCSVAIIKNAPSDKMGRKDIIKIDEVLDVDLDMLGYIDPGATVNIIRDGVLVEKRHLELPEQVENVIFCKNPRCIVTSEREISHIFRLSDRERGVYRCIYCETEGKRSEEE